nr:MAG TPA: hypothetical protein [Inoviridae sp.]
MSISVGLDRNFVRFLPFINSLSRDEYRNSLIENDSVTPEILEKELSIYDYIDKRYSNALKQAREDDVLFEFVIDLCKFFKELNIVLGETDEATIIQISKRLDRIEKEEENRLKNEKLRKKQKKMKRKLKVKNRRK